jgi:hypothetical protein
MFCHYDKHYNIPSILEFERMLPCKKTRAYLEMEVECKLASQEKNPKKEVHVVNSQIPKKNPSNHDTKKVLPDC